MKIVFTDIRKFIFIENEYYLKSKIWKYFKKLKSGTKTNSKSSVEDNDGNIYYVKKIFFFY